MSLKGRDTAISHALQPPAPPAQTAQTAQTANVAAPAAAAAEGARLAVATDPTHLLTERGLADIRRLVASAGGAVHVPQALATAPPAGVPHPAGPGPSRSPWAWLWAVLESVATLYVALTEPQRRSGRRQA